MTNSTDQPDIRLKRAYEPSAASDGTRVLIDQLWPHSVTKERAALDHWFRSLAPNMRLRKWFGHNPTRWDEFRRHYTVQLSHHPDEFDELLRLAQNGPVTLVFGARDEQHNNAVVVREMLLDWSDRRKSSV